MPGYKILLIFLFCLFGHRLPAQQGSYRVITQDALHFWQAYDSLEPGADTMAVFQRLVIDRATPSFRLFIGQWKITARNYALQLRAFPKFYASIRKNCLALCRSEDSIRALVKKLETLYPRFVAADICIGLGNFSTGGTASVSAADTCVYIGLEYHAIDSSAVITELGSTIRDYSSHSNFFRTVAHELVHVQQLTHGKKVSKSYYGDALVHAVLREGIPEFIAELVYPSGNRGSHFSYGLQHEQALKLKLKEDLWRKDKSFWIYNSAMATVAPKDLGYFMGSRIAQSYYELNKAVKDVLIRIIEITDVEDFIASSHYFTGS